MSSSLNCELLDATEAMSPDTTTKPKARFTLDGSATLEARLEALCEEIRSATLQVVPHARLQGLVLGGGYGRGHGGVLETGHGDAPYNDLEFYAFIRGNALLNRGRYAESLKQLGERLSPGAGLHVEFKVDSLDKLRRSPVSIFSYDLVSGHRIIHGDASLFRGCEHHLDPRRILPSEATRLLLNRCSGLLLVKELLLRPYLTPDDCDFIGRNLAKAELALGDAWLAAEGQYHWDCRERARRVERFTQEHQWPLAEAILKHHTNGVGFKLHPARIVKSTVEFRQEHGEISELALNEWLWIENGRLKTRFASLHEYSLSSGLKCSETNGWHNLLLNVRTFGPSAVLGQSGCRYPRERLFNALPLLLDSSEPATEPLAKRHLQQQLQTGAEDWHGLVNAYKDLWSAYG